MTQTEKQTFGQWGEEQAVAYLEKKGYIIVDRNFRIRQGEVDIIAWNRKPHFGRTLCFIEVKTRKQNKEPLEDGDGTAERATGREKMTRLSSASKWYCVSRGINIEKTPIQFEQVSVYAKGPDFSVRHYVVSVE